MKHFVLPIFLHGRIVNYIKIYKWCFTLLWTQYIPAFFSSATSLSVNSRPYIIKNKKTIKKHAPTQDSNGIKLYIKSTNFINLVHSLTANKLQLSRNLSHRLVSSLVCKLIHYIFILIMNGWTLCPNQGQKIQKNAVYVQCCVRPAAHKGLQW